MYVKCDPMDGRGEITTLEVFHNSFVRASQTSSDYRKESDFLDQMVNCFRSQWPRGLRRRSAALSPAEIAGSNPAGVMDVCMSLVLCVVR